MDNTLLIEKYQKYDFPVSEDNDIVFMQGNKSIMWRENNHGIRQVGYVSLNKRRVSSDLQLDSSKRNFLKFRDGFFIPANISYVDDEDLKFSLHSMSSKRRHNGDYYYFGFNFRLNKFADYKGKIGLSDFVRLLNIMEQKIINYESEKGFSKN